MHGSSRRREIYRKIIYFNLLHAEIIFLQPSSIFLFDVAKEILKKFEHPKASPGTTATPSSNK